MAERDLATLLKTLTVKRHEGVWTYKIHTGGHAGTLVDWIKQRAFGTRARFVMEEAEGVTEITLADFRTPADNRWVWLELAVYSDLNAVGFLAAVASALAEAGVPCNAVAAFHHDHIFVPEDKAEIAIAAIEALAADE